MALARDQAGNVWDVTNPDNPVLVQPAQQTAPAQGGIFQDPYIAAEQARASATAGANINRTQTQTALDQARVPHAPSVASSEAREAQAKATTAEAAAQRAEIELDTLSGVEEGKRETAQRSGQTALRSITRALEYLEQMPQGEGVAGSAARIAQARVPGTPAYYFRQQVADFQNNVGVQSLQEMRNNSPTGGALGNITERQLNMMRDLMGSFDIGQPVSSLRENLNQINNNFLEIIHGSPAERDRLLERGEISPQQYRAVENAFRDTEFDEFGRRRDRSSDVERGREAAGFGAAEQSLPIPPEMQQAHAQYLADNWGNIDPEEYAQFRAGLDERFGFGKPPLEEYAASALGLNERAAAGMSPEGLPIPDVTAPLEGMDAFRHDLVSNPIGAFGAGLANAGAGGIPSLFAREQMEALRGANPWSSLGGELVGGVTGTMLTGSALGGLAGRIASPGVSSAIANPLTADVLYGSLYGATQADDPLIGALTGAGAGAAGSIIGSQVARRIPGVVGRSRPQDPLNRGERNVLEAVDRTGRDDVLAALAQADELGVPATLSDVSTSVESLAGSSIRHSPEVAASAREALSRRSRGQIDRFAEAIERDLGPIDNIPQRSLDLIEQARIKAKPLYEEAYSAPGASSVKLDDLISRPTFKKALGEAYGEVADEGLDPSALGFNLSDDGVTSINLSQLKDAQSPGWRTLDYVKRGLDNIIEHETDPIKGMTPAGRRADAMKNILVDRMDEVNPAYRAARQAWGGPAAERAIMRAGEDAARATPNQLGVDIAGRTPEQLQQMQLGFQSKLLERGEAARSTTNPFQSQLDTPAMERRLNVLYPEGGDNIARLLAQRDLERGLAETGGRLIGNSATAERVAADAAFRQGDGLRGALAQGAIETAISGMPVMTGLRALGGRVFRNRAQQRDLLGRGQQAYEQAGQIAPLALDTIPTRTMEIVRELGRRDSDYQAILEALLESAATRGGHSGAGLGVTGSVSAQRR